MSQDDKDREVLDERISRVMIELDREDLPPEVRLGLQAELSILMEMWLAIGKPKPGSN